MIREVPARDLKPGDVFSTDNYKVERVHTLWDKRVSVSLWSPASGGISKHAVLDPDFSCALWVEDE